MTELSIPDEAKEEFGAAIDGIWLVHIDDQAMVAESAFKSAVPLVVAAELDRLADQWEPKPLPANVTLARGSDAEQHRERNWFFANRLRARAKELRGEA